MRRARAQVLLAAIAACLFATPAMAQGEASFQQLDIGLIAFDPGIPEDEGERKARRIFPEVRRAEANYLPYVLRQALEQADRWGVVRVLPEVDPSAELLVTGTIIRSDGISLEIAVHAVDCTGREWLARTYQAKSTERDYAPGRDRSKPLFSELFRQIGEDLYHQAELIGTQGIGRIEQVSQLLYARSLVPDAFEGYLVRNAEAHWELRRLPAENDPLMSRIDRVREHEFLFVDTVDEQYAALYDQMTPSYDLWRQFNREQVLYQEAHAGFLKGRSERSRDEYESMRRAYEAYKWSRIEQQEVALLATGLNNELSPTLLTLDNQIITLDGSLQDRHAQWRRILRRMFELDTGAAERAGG